MIRYKKISICFHLKTVLIVFILMYFNIKIVTLLIDASHLSEFLKIVKNIDCMYLELTA